jgi:hypothetical protein
MELSQTWRTAPALAALLLMGCESGWGPSNTTFDAENRPTFTANMDRGNQQVKDVSLTYNVGSTEYTIPKAELESQGDRYRVYTYQAPVPALANTQITARWFAEFSYTSDTTQNTVIAPGPMNVDLDIADVWILDEAGQTVPRTPAAGWTGSGTANQYDYSWLTGKPVSVVVVVTNAGTAPVPPTARIRLIWQAPGGPSPSTLPVPQTAPGADSAVTFAPVSFATAGGGTLVAQVENNTGDVNPGNDFLNTSFYVQPADPGS